MNTINNFNVSTTNYRNNQSNNNNIQFKGFLNKGSLKVGAKRRLEMLECVEVLSGRHMEELKEITKNSTLKQVHFLKMLAQQHNAQNFHSKQKISSDIILKIFSTIKEPTLNDEFLLKKSDIPLEFLERIFKEINGDPKKSEFAVKITKEVLSSAFQKEQSYELIPQLLESKNSQEYINNFKKYKSYIILNKSDKNMVQNLDSLVESNSFDEKKYNKILSIKDHFSKSKFCETPVLNKEVLYSIYTEEGNEILKEINDLNISHRSIIAGNDQDIMSIYRTTTKKNLPARRVILEQLKRFALDYQNKEGQVEDLTELRKLFEKMDENDEVFKFMQKEIKSTRNIVPLKRYNELLEAIPAKKLNIFYSNYSNIEKKVDENEQIDFLKKELENPFFETFASEQNKRTLIEDGYLKPESLFSKAKKYLINKFNQFRYHRTDEYKQEISKKSETIVPEFVYETQAPIEVLPQQNNLALEVVKPPVRTKYRKLRFVPKAPDAKKLAVINDVNGIIEKKLGSKTLSEQKREYAVTTTKMRMNMLPEIFDSIKDTRAAKRAAGQKPDVANKDALDLYQMINGRNKKLVNYMLKKRNADGTRKFDIKQIIQTVNEANRNIINDRRKAPKTYKAADAKAHYNNLLDNYIQQYGKLDRKKVAA